MHSKDKKNDKGVTASFSCSAHHSKQASLCCPSLWIEWPHACTRDTHWSMTATPVRNPDGTNGSREALSAIHPAAASRGKWNTCPDAFLSQQWRATSPVGILNSSGHFGAPLPPQDPSDFAIGAPC